MLPDLKAAGIGVLPGLNRDDLNILEIGANDGTDTQEFLRAFPKGHVTCFECDPRAIKLWQALIGTHPRAALGQLALSDMCGRTLFYQSDGKPPWANGEQDPPWDKSGSLLTPDRHTEFQPWLTFPETIEVEVRTLDAVLTGIITAPRGTAWQEDIIDFAWVDAQGSEAAILRGGQQTIKRIRYWYCEVHALPYYKGQATLDEIKALLPGFELYSEHEGENVLFKNTAI